MLEEEQCYDIVVVPDQDWSSGPVSKAAEGFSSIARADPHHFDADDHPYVD